MSKDATIHILDHQSGAILDYITGEKIITDEHRKSLEDTLETYSFTTFADKRFSQYLEKRNRIIIPDENGNLIEFIISETQKYHSRDGHLIDAFAQASYLDDLSKAKVLYPNESTRTAAQHVGFALNDSGWRVGVVESSRTRTLSITEHTSPFAFLKHIAKEFELELNFRAEHDGNRVVGRYVDLLERVGTWQGREVEFGKDLNGIRRVEKQDVVTALLGLGPEREDGTRLEVLETDEDALRRWGRVDDFGNLKHLIEAYEIQSDRTEMTEAEARRYTRTALNKRINTHITYEADIVDLENVPGLKHKKIRFGDTIRIKDTTFNPPLYLEARVFEQTRSIKNKAHKEVKLGDFIEFTEDEVRAIWKQLQAEIRKRVSIDLLKQYAEPKKILSDEPPSEQHENVIWVDTSKEPYIPKVYNFGEWQKMAPTDAVEVGAYTRQETDNIAEDADRLKKGIIDVGAVPIRTSVTGARIEWDGLNGLVQYDVDGNPISWLDLDGNAHFENGYFSGEIQANRGHFSGDVTGATGEFGEVTVLEGDLTVKDKLSNTKAIVTPLPNLIGDHNFEELKVDLTTENETYNWYEMINPTFVDYHPHQPYWKKSGSPKVAMVPYFGEPDYRAKPIFDSKAIVVRDANFVRQFIAEGIGAGGTYTISAYFKRHWGQAAGVPRFEVDYVTKDGRTRLINHTYDRVPNDYTPIRFATSFTVPITFSLGEGEYLDIKISGGDNNWVQCDGVQLASGDLPPVYDPETTAQKAIDMIYWGQTALWSGESYLSENQTVTPDIPLSHCRNGWMLRWQAYNPGDSIVNSDYLYRFIPKSHSMHSPGRGIRNILARGGIGTIGKYFYVHDDRIVGHASNAQGDNRYLVLSGVFEW